jgi:MFS family permease
MIAAAVQDGAPLESARQGGPSLMAAWCGLAVLSVAMMFSVMDRQILVLITEPLKHSMRLGDTQIGLLNGLALTLVSALATYPMGVLADRFDRPRLLAVCVLIWSAAAAACGLAQTFGALFACSMGIAIGEAVLGPISYSLIADMFPRQRWLTVNYVFFISNILGGAAGLALGGAAFGLAETHRGALPPGLAGFESWRLAMMLVAIPGPVIAAAILFIRTRQRTALGAGRTPGIGPYLRAHLRTLTGIFLGFGFAAAAQVTLATWVMIGLTRDFGQTPAEVGARIGAVSAAASLSGVFLSGFLVRKLRPRFGDVTMLRVAQIGIGAACVAMLVFPFARTSWQVYAAQFVAGLPMIAAISLSPTFLQNSAPGPIRSRVIALGGLFYVIFNALTPIAVGMVSDSAFGASFGLYWSMLVVALPCAVAGILFLTVAGRDLSITFAAAAEGAE